jgi:hypothetical protein
MKDALESMRFSSEKTEAIKKAIFYQNATALF